MSGDCKDTEDTATLRKESHKLLERLGVLGCNRGIQQFQQKGQMKWVGRKGIGVWGRGNVSKVFGSC